MSIIKRFKNTRPGTNYIFRNGKYAHFIHGNKFDTYDTDVEAEIAELNAEVAGKNPHIYIDLADSEYDSDAPTPVEQMRARIREEYLAELAAQGKLALDASKNGGSTAQGKLVMQNSAGVSSGAGESTSADTAPVNVTSEAAAAAATAKVSLPANALAALTAKSAAVAK